MSSHLSTNMILFYILLISLLEVMKKSLPSKDFIDLDKDFYLTDLIKKDAVTGFVASGI